MNLEAGQFAAFEKAYAALSEVSGEKLLVETYFTDLPAEAYKTLCSLPIAGVGVDLVRGSKTLSLIKEQGLPAGKTLFAGVVDGRNIWANDLLESVDVVEELQAKLEKELKFLKNGDAGLEKMMMAK